MISAVSVTGQLGPLFLGSGEAEHHGRRLWWSRADQLMVSKKQRERKRARQEGGRDKILFKGMPL
jgi:hypothetical protein